jgi:hypothetical protein
MDHNSNACAYCGSHGLDMRGNCASCGAPTDYRPLQSPQYEMMQFYGDVMCTTSDIPAEAHYRYNPSYPITLWENMVSGANNAWEAIAYRQSSNIASR